MTEIFVYTNTGRVFRIVENDEGKVSIITNGQIVYEDKPAIEFNATATRQEIKMEANQNDWYSRILLWSRTDDRLGKLPYVFMVVLAEKISQHLFAKQDRLDNGEALDNARESAE